MVRWGPYFGNPLVQDTKMRAVRRGRLAKMYTTFVLMPCLLCYVAFTPGFLEWFMKRTQWFVYPAEADPKIMSDIYSGRQPTGSSYDNYKGLVMRQKELGKGTPPTLPSTKEDPSPNQSNGSQKETEK
eukprot:GHVN01078094.1.p1 GENE.GHVN01078094.1~~GHVN01078094.1.p1  ORF type:complete len:128 (+),score=23.20 GHVN01078094.1:85-468(+)